MRKLVLLLIAAVLVALVAVRLYQEIGSGAAEAGGGGPPRGPAPLVGTAKAEPHVFEEQLVALGELKPEAEVVIQSKISGRLNTLVGDRGDTVSSGDLVAVVEDDELVEQIQRADASLAVTRAGVKREEATLENLRVQVKRYGSLYQEGLISAEELETLESRERVSEANVELAKAQVRQAEASLSELRIQQQNTRIHSPLDGFVGTRHLDPGALVSPGVPILTVMRIDKVKTVVPVIESVLQQIRIGLPATIVVDAYPRRTFRASVTRISPFLNTATRSAEVEIETDNPDRILKPGMFARVTIDVSVTREVTSIPRAGLVMRGNRQGVFRLSDQQTALFQPIEVGAIAGDRVEVVSGLNEGTEIVTAGAQQLNEGDKVRTE